LAAFGGTIGGGFIWRSLARGLVGLVPVWGIIPKTAVAYAGTYALGQGIVQWYLTGREITPEMMRGFYKEALARGKAIARALVERAPKRTRRLSLPRRTKRVET
jgi:GNAT superfamily N-acetyltransferase